jgi:FHA domain/FhaA, N-terminal domain
MARIDDIESRLQSLLEVHLLKYLPGYRSEDRIIQQLAVALHSNLKQQEEMTLAPNVYVVVAHPTILTRWRVEPRLFEELAGALFTVGNEAGYVFLGKPTVTTAADVSMTTDRIRILASFSGANISDTKGLPVGSKNLPTPEIVPANAFLIVHGTQVVPLARAVINIGRRLDNQVVIDDPRVSRTHAQLRVVKGRFVLFDLNSSGGSFVNGQRITQSVLYPGDVISLAGVNLIFGQDLPTGRSSEDGTRPSTISADRPTAILKKDEFEG